MRLTLAERRALRDHHKARLDELLRNFPIGSAEHARHRAEEILRAAKKYEYWAKRC